ncbi:Hypp9368 [Branchiostoma lanceolatum]|uniref:Hypp9368 protein n=1 Tax=Branchiostoma lanceolatum TaxID=7740 RepID=A0A8S4MLH0_BRALA|nr:Hypp9368 [Branchiostoma lanceolatum]
MLRNCRPLTQRNSNADIGGPVTWIVVSDIEDFGRLKENKMESTVVIKEEKEDIQATYECILRPGNGVNYSPVPSCNEHDVMSTYVSTKTENSEEELSPIPPWLASETIEPAVATEDGTQSTIPLHDQTLHSFDGSGHTEEHPGTALCHFRIEEDDRKE